MANKKINDLTAVAAVAAGDEFEVQKSGETSSKKATTTQITAIEAAARAAQDDVIEASVGLSAAGAYEALTNAWYLRAADFTAGVTDRGGATGALTGSIKNAIRILDAQLYAASYTLSQAIRSVNVTCSTADILACNATPKVLIAFEDDYLIEVLSVVGQLDYGGTGFSAGTDKLEIRYSGGGGTVCELSNAFLEATADCVYRGVMKTTTEIINSSEGLEMYCATPPTLGNSTMQITILYRKYAVIF